MISSGLQALSSLALNDVAGADAVAGLGIRCGAHQGEQGQGQQGQAGDQVIGWGGGSWRSEPSRKVPQWLRTEVVGLLCARSAARAVEAASGKQAAGAVMAFPSFLSAELLAAHCPGYFQRHSAGRGAAAAEGAGG